MRILLLSDIHGNLEALQTILQATPFEAAWVLGDLVGYGADPNRVVEIIRDLQPQVLIRGNHDRVCSGLEPPEGFSRLAREAALWTLDALTPENRNYLRTLPKGPVVQGNYLICHGSPADEDEYLWNAAQVEALLGFQSPPVCFFGHTHVPIVFRCVDRQRIDSQFIQNPSEMILEPATRFFINPGAVGQPRNRDPRASAALLDSATGTINFLKVPYDIEAAALKIERAGLPPPLAERLFGGW
ncbi:MAG: metallophosphoesterase family protein [Acidobacteria bacterium]|nr:metallophosphoesterase family protein [Acidobacteriota bacterium]